MSILKSATIFSLFFMLTLGGIEIYLQLSEIDLSYHRLHPELGKTIQPDTRIIMLKEGFYLGKSNKYGYLGPAYPPEKSPDVFRIALMGDSYAEGFQLADKFHFRTILEKELSERSGKQVEILNFGSGNFNFHDMHLAYKNMAQDYHPDMVLYLLEPKRFIDRANYFIPSPYFYEEGEELKINYEFNERGLFKTYNKLAFLLENSSFLKMGQNSYKMVRQGRAPGIIFDKFYRMFRYSKAKDIDLEDVDDVIEITSLTERIVEDIAEGPPSVILFRKKYPDNLREMMDSYELPHINLADTLDVMRLKGGLDNHPRYWKATSKKGHWNHEGHKLVGHYLGNQLLPYIK
ncbi:MAG: hypothetical protein AAF587_12885 [Bacteroidota bacterium]